MHRPWRSATLLLFVIWLSLAALGQQGQLPDAPKKGDALPEAPSANNPLTAPSATPQSSTGTGEASSTDTRQESNAAADSENPPKVAPRSSGWVSPSNRAANQTSSGYDQTDAIFRVSVNAVPVPVTVKDAAGHLFPGLTKENFSVYEDGVKQPIRFFTSDPFPVSAAVLIDVGMPDIALQKVKATFPALIGAFSQFDAIAIYTFGNTVTRHQDFVAALGDTTSRTISKINETQSGRGSGPAVFNPMTVGPSVNGRVFDPGTQRNQIELAPPKEAEPSRVLNDAMLQAANDLGRQPKARRRVIFIISDGREYGSRASYQDVLRVLLTNNVSVYGVAVDATAIPGYNKLEKIHLPRQGYGNILPKYSSATGGEIFNEFTSRALEAAYGSAMEESRSQYTLVYNSPETKSTSYRKIEVRVSGYGPSLKVFARDGFYPVPTKE